MLVAVGVEVELNESGKLAKLLDRWAKKRSANQGSSLNRNTGTTVVARSSLYSIWLHYQCSRSTISIIKNNKI